MAPVSGHVQDQALECGETFGRIVDLRRDPAQPTPFRQPVEPFDDLRSSESQLVCQGLGRARLHPVGGEDRQQPEIGPVELPQGRGSAFLLLGLPPSSPRDSSIAPESRSPRTASRQASRGNRGRAHASGQSASHSRGSAATSRPAAAAKATTSAGPAELSIRSQVASGPGTVSARSRVDHLRSAERLSGRDRSKDEPVRALATSGASSRSWAKAPSSRTIRAATSRVP